MMRAFRFCLIVLAWSGNHHLSNADGSKARSIRGRSLSGSDQDGEDQQDEGSGWGGPWFGGGGEDHGGPDDSFDWNGTPPMDGPWHDDNATFDGNGTFGHGGWPPMHGPWHDGNATFDGNHTFEDGPWNSTPPFDVPWHDGNGTFGPGDWNGDDDFEMFKNTTEGWMSEAFAEKNWTQGGDWLDGNETRPSQGWGHHHGPPGGMFGPAHAGAGQAMGPFIPSWTSSIKFGGLDCPLSGASSSNEPACAANPKGDTGVWVCRSLTNPFTGESESLSVCADSNQTIEAVDECGCCGGSCPQVCLCNCTTPFGDDGVRVAMNVTDMGGSPTEVCMDSKFAVGIVGGVFSCVADCSAPMQTPPPYMMMPGVGGHD